jgi:hypothetical protein
MLEACSPVRATRYLIAAAAVIALGVIAPSAGATVTGSNDAGAVATAIGDGSPGLVTGAAFTIAGPVAECADGIDNDGEGGVDFPADSAGCKSATDDSENNDLEQFSVPECQNKFDDDTDGNIDTADSGCASPTDADEGTAGNQEPECTSANEDDFDTDGGTFAAGDPECTAAADNDESFEEQCGDGTDNDEDGLTDGADGGCDFPYDDDESSENPPPASNIKQSGIGDTGLAGFPTANSTFGVLTSGDAELADDPNNSGGSGASTGGVAYGQANDPVTLKIDLNVPTGTNCVGFDFRFLSDEFPEFVNAGFNDAFIAQLDQVSINVAGSSITAPNDFAAGTGDQISVDASGPSGMSDLFASGTTYDGATPRLVARHLVDPGKHSLFLTIFDAGDHILDSAVFVDNLRATNEPQGECKSLAVEPFEGKSGVSFGGDPNNPLSVDPTLTFLQMLMHCNLPSGNEFNCPENLLASFTPSTGTQTGQRSGKRATTTLASGSTTIPAGTTQQVSLPTTPEGKAALQAAKDEPAELRAQAKKQKQKAKKLKKKAKKAPTKAQAKKLLKKAKKALKKAKQLEAQAAALEAQPLGTVNLTITNPTNGATDNLTLSLPR